MIVDAMYPYPGADLTMLVEASDEVRRSRLVTRDRRWSSKVAARWTHLELSRQQLDQCAVAYDLRLSGERPLGADAAVVAQRIHQRLS